MSKLVLPPGSITFADAAMLDEPTNTGPFEISVPDTNLVSDGYHTFGELYDHRALLFIALCNALPAVDSWKSYRDGSGLQLEDGWFLTGLRLPCGDISYHLPAKFWTLLKSPQWDKAPDWDGHTSEDVAERLTKLSKSYAYSPASLKP